MIFYLDFFIFTPDLFSFVKNVSYWLSRFGVQSTRDFNSAGVVAANQGIPLIAVLDFESACKILRGMHKSIGGTGCYQMTCSHSLF